jgi:hypothetical protein
MVEAHLEKRAIGYARVSTYGQTLDSQLAQPWAAGCGSRNIYRETVTGVQLDRRELSRMHAVPRRRGDRDAHRPAGAAPLTYGRSISTMRPRHPRRVSRSYTDGESEYWIAAG